MWSDSLYLHRSVVLRLQPTVQYVWCLRGSRIDAADRFIQFNNL